MMQTIKGAAVLPYLLAVALAATSCFGTKSPVTPKPTSTPVQSPSPSPTPSPTITPTIPAPVKLPNLVPYDIKISPNSGDYLQSEVSVEVANRGEGNVAEFVFRVVNSRNAAVLWEGTFPALPAGQSQTVKTTLAKLVDKTLDSKPFRSSLVLVPGEYTLRLVADPSDVVKESNEADNTLSKKMVLARLPYTSEKVSPEMQKLGGMISNNMLITALNVPELCNALKPYQKDLNINYSAVTVHSL